MSGFSPFGSLSNLGNQVEHTAAGAIGSAASGVSKGLNDVGQGWDTLINGSKPAPNAPQPAAAPTQGDPSSAPQAGAQTSNQATGPAFSYDLNGVNPSSDLTYNAFLRGYGMDQATANAQAAYQRSAINSQLAASIPGMELSRQEGVTGDINNAANAGGVRGSANLLAQNNTNTGINDQENVARTNAAVQSGQVSLGLQSTMNSLNEQQAQQDLAARQRLVDQNNSMAAYRYAMGQFGNPSYQSVQGQG